MIFSYRVKDKYILDSINVPLSSGKLLLLTGVENMAFGLLGGIVSGLFPLEKEDTFPPLEELMAYFTGELSIKEGGIFSDAVYLGPDPERHLLFSRVHEEIFAQSGISNESEQLEVLELFGLSGSFLERRISTLSGGEKMKLALSIALSKSFDCIVLHGVIPWLDNCGVSQLFRRIERLRYEGKAVVILEQEINDIKRHADEVLFFDGEDLHPYSPRSQSAWRKRFEAAAARMRIHAGGRSSAEEVVRFDSVSYSYEHAHDKNLNFSLNDLYFTLMSGTVYGLIGDNGAGKSTIAKLMMRMEKPSTGRIYFGGEEISAMPRERLVRSVCYVGQFPERQITASSVSEYQEKAKRGKNELSLKFLKRLFPQNGKYPVSTLSPFEMKMLLLLSNAGSDARLIILDEPTWGVDIPGQAFMLEVIRDLTAELLNPAVLIISHDLEFVKSLDASILMIREKTVHECRSIALARKMLDRTRL